MVWRNLRSLLGRKTKRCPTPTLLQMEAVECGAAALGIILGYYGRIVPLAELRQACGVSRDGSKVSNMLRAAAGYGLQAKGYKTDLDALWQLKCPYIVFWNFNHFLVVEGLTKQRAYLNDPATGRRTVSLEEFSGAYTGIVLVFEPGSEFKKGGRKPSTTLALWSRLQGSLGALIYCVLAGFLLVIPGLAIPGFSQIFVDNVLIQNRQEWLRPLILGIILTAVLNGFLTLLQLQFLRRMKIKLSVGMMSKFLWHLLHLPVGFYDQRFAGEISSRVQLNDSLANFLSGKLATTVIAAVSVIIYAVVMLQYDVVLTLIALVFIAVNLAALQWVRRQRVDANTKLIQEYGKVSGTAISGLQSMETLKASGLESDFFSRWAGHYAKAINARQELEATNQTLGVLPTFLSAVASMLLLAIGGLRVMDGILTIGMLVAFQGMMQRLLEPVTDLVNLGSDLQEMEGNLNRLDDVLCNPIDPQLEQGTRGQRDNGIGGNTSPHLKLQGYVELRNITFGYNRVAPPLIENFSLSLKPGQRVALVGGSGSGKSTIAKLVCGLYEPWQGEIRFDGKSRGQIPRQVLANSISAVEQEVLLFAGSVRDNLTLWDTTIPDTNLVRACKDAALHEVISLLPGGYNADLLEGATNLSGGQRQRLDIARALVNNPTILVMDEATSALDAETEKSVDRHLRLRGCTCIIVAHRLSTIRDCDEIIVLDRGRIVQRGTHEALQQTEGPYLQLLQGEEDVTQPNSLNPEQLTNSTEAQKLSSLGFGGIKQQNGNPLPEIFDDHSDLAQIARPPVVRMEILNGATRPPQGRYRRFKGNESFLLEDPQTVWVVKSGYLELFAIIHQNGILEGTRHHLFSVRPGQAMFGTAPSSHKQHQLLAVAMEDTELLRVSVEEFNQLIANADAGAVALIEGWIDQLGTTITKASLPMTALPQVGIRDLSLVEDQIFQPQQDKVSWVQVRQGRARWMGVEELPLTAASGVLPLGINMWLQADNRVELKIASTSEILDGNTILSGLAQLQIYCLNCLELLQQQEMDAEFLRFQARESLDHQIMQATLGELASVLEPSQLAFSPNGTQTSNSDELLLAAAGAVGRALGIEIRPPAKSDNPKRAKEPVGAIARASRVRIRRITLRHDWWKQDSGPMLAHMLEGKRPVALLPGSNSRYEIFDPLTQRRIPVDARTAAVLIPTAYVFYRPFPNKHLKALDLLQFALEGHTRELLVITLTGIAFTLLGMLTPQAIAILIDKAIPDADRGLLSQIAIGLVAAAFGGMLFQLAQGFAIIRLETFADSATQAAVWDRLLNLKTVFFRQFSVGDLNSRVTAISQIRQRLGSTVLKTIFSSLFSLLNLGLLFYYSASLALVASGVALVNIAVTTLSGILMVRKVRPLLEIEGQISGVMVELINGVAKLRIAKAEARAFAHWGQQYTQQLKLILSTQVIEDFLAVTNKVLPALTTAALFWFAAGLIGQSQSGETGLSTGAFLAFNVAFGTFITGAISLSTTVVEVLQVLPLWQRAEPILRAEPEINSTLVDPGRLMGKLVVNHVTFRYRSDGPPVLDDVSIHAEPGEFIAIVGPSGSGKSTLLRLLLGFESPDSGATYYDKQNLAMLDVRAVRRQLGVVLQDSRLMSASIFENIASGALITMDEAWAAVEMAGLAKEIAEMPMGIHTVVSEGGGNLSGGQRQRLLIAKALVLKPRILLFDEATSALDNNAQAIVTQSLEQLQVTRVVIAHRLSTIQNADRIYVLQAGRVMQQGSFSKLANQAGLFAQLMLRQML